MEILFLNYGYEDDKARLHLDKKDEPNRYSIQLYHHLIRFISVENKDIVEIGCGRGGGLAYIVKHFTPATAKGIDLDKVAITFCNKHYSLNGLSFAKGEAQNILLQDSSCDVIINIESSHRYQDMPLFLKEVKRIMKPGGYFLFTDFRYDYEMPVLKQELQESGLLIVNEEVITPQVVNALAKDDERRRSLVKKLVPRILQKIALNFAGAKGTETYRQFESNKYVYYSYILQKN